MGPSYTIAYVTRQPITTDRLMEVIRSGMETKAGQLGLDGLLVYLAHEGGGTPYRMPYGQAGILGIEIIHDELMDKSDPSRPADDRSLANTLYSAGVTPLFGIGVNVVGLGDK